MLKTLCITGMVLAGSISANAATPSKACQNVLEMDGIIILLNDECHLNVDMFKMNQLMTYICKGVPLSDRRQYSLMGFQTGADMRDTDLNGYCSFMKQNIPSEIR